MKAQFIRGTTLHGKVVNGGDILDLDEREYHLFVKTYRDAVPYIDPEPVAAEPPADEKKGKKK